MLEGSFGDIKACCQVINNLIKVTVCQAFKSETPVVIHLDRHLHLRKSLKNPVIQALL